MEQTSMRAKIIDFYKKMALPNIPTTSNLNFDGLDWNGYDNDEKNEFVHMLINFIAKEFAKSEFIHMDENGEATGEINKLLGYAPNKHQIPFDFLHTIAYQLYYYKNVIITPNYEVTESGDWELAELNVMDGSKFEFGLGYHEELSQLFIKIRRISNGETIVLPYEDIIHLRANPNAMFNGDQNNFLNVAQGYENLLDEAIASELTKLKDNTKIKFVFKKTSGNGSALKGRVQLDDDTKKETARKVAQRLSHDFIVLDDGESLEQLTRDINLLDTDKLNHIKKTLFTFYGLTEDLLNGNVDYDKMEIFYNKEIKPIALKLEQELTKKLISYDKYKKGERIIHFHNPLNYVPLANIGDFLYKTSHLFKVNEVRAWKGLPPVEGGDVLLQNKNFENPEQAEKYYSNLEAKSTSKGGEASE